MNDFPRWKYAIVVVVLFLGVLYGLPNLFVQQPAVQVNANRGATIDDALKEQVQGVLEKAKIAFDRIELNKDQLMVRLPIGDLDGQGKAQDALRTELGDRYVVAPNLASTVPAWMRAIGAREMPKGLDLQGGVHFLMEVDDKDVVEKQLQRYADDIRSALRDKNIRYQSVGRGPQGVVVQLRSAEDRDASMAAIQSKVPDVVVSNGSQVGDSYTLNASARPEKIREIALNTIRQNQATLSNRINALGVAEPLIQQQARRASRSNCRACRTLRRRRRCSVRRRRSNIARSTRTAARTMRCAPARCRPTTSSTTSVSAAPTASRCRSC